MGDVGHRLAHGGHPLGRQKPLGLFGHEGLEVFGVGPDLLPHPDPVPGPFQCYFEGLVVDRLGDEIGGIPLEAFYRQVHVSMAGDHDHLGVGGPGFDFFQEVDPVHAGHLDVGQDNGGGLPVEGIQGFGARCGGHHLVAHVGEEDGEDVPDVFLVVHQQDRLGRHRVSLTGKRSTKQVPPSISGSAQMSPRKSLTMP